MPTRAELKTASGRKERGCNKKADRQINVGEGLPRTVCRGEGEEEEEGNGVR